MTIPIVYLAPVAWNSLWQRPQQLAVGLAQGHSVTYVEPVGLRSIRPRDLTRIWRRVAGRRPAQSRMSIVRPAYVPAFALPGADQLNRRWLSSQLRKVLPGNRQPWILWIGTPSLLADVALRANSPTVTVYDCMDYYAGFHSPADRPRIIETERRILAQADCVFASSAGLLSHVRRHTAASTLLPNGVDIDRFSVVRRPPPPDALRGIRRPLLGLHGTLGPWIDYATLDAIARARPDWSLVLAGPKCSAAASRLISRPNVHHLGTIDYDELPSLAAHFDVALAPFVLNELTRCVHPIKALEYLALGLPTVASRLPSLLEMNDVIQFAATAAEWIDAVSAALGPAARDPGIVAARREAARGQSWEHRVRQIEAHLAVALRAAKENRGQDRRPDRRRAA